MFEPNDWNRLSRFAKKVTLGLLWLVVKRENRANQWLAGRMKPWRSFTPHDLDTTFKLLQTRLHERFLPTSLSKQ